MTGLESNGYYINNEIWVAFPSYAGNSYFTVRIENLTDPTITPFVNKVYASPNGTARINIAPILKSMFTQSNSNEFKITRILSSNNASISLQKKFIRGGIRTSEINQKALPNVFLNPALKYPVFQGYPISFNYIDGDYNITEMVIEDMGSSLLDYRIPKGCNGAYFRFLNQLGGYSYWYFESFSKIQSSDNLGGFVNKNNNVDDLGNNVSFQFKAFSKFPKEYISLALDIEASPEVYVFREGTFKRIRNTKANIEEDDNKRAYSVSVKFDYDTRFNPSLLWSN